MTGSDTVSLSARRLLVVMAWFLCFVFLLVPQLTQLTLVRAVQIITPEIAPPDLSEPCLEALTANLTCGPMVPRFRFGYYYAESTLEAACTSECELDLVAYETDVLTACDGDVWSGYDDEGDAPLGLIPSLVRFQYGLTCLKDSGRWCNVVSGEAAYYYDPGGMFFFSILFLFFASILLFYLRGYPLSLNPRILHDCYSPAWSSLAFTFT